MQSQPGQLYSKIQNSCFPCHENAQILAPCKKILGSLHRLLLHTRGHLQVKAVVLKLWFKISRVIIIFKNSDSQVRSHYLLRWAGISILTSSLGDSDIHEGLRILQLNHFPDFMPREGDAVGSEKSSSEGKGLSSRSVQSQSHTGFWDLHLMLLSEPCYIYYFTR